MLELGHPAFDCCGHDFDCKATGRACFP
jgi:hypothetical protein